MHPFSLMDLNGKISHYWHQKYRQDLGKNWNLFYARNTTNFFRDRHWIAQEFPELLEGGVVFEVGCGVGNFGFPLEEEAGTGITKFYGCDISPKAVELFQQNEAFDPVKMQVFVADITKELLTDKIPSGSVNIATSIFVLSALPPETLPFVIRNVWSCLAEQGCWFIRDYAVNDAAQLRFDPAKSQLQKNLFVRQDGTLAHYFDQQELLQLVSPYFRVLECKEIQSRTQNRKENLDLERRFLQLKLEKRDEVDDNNID